MRELRNRFLEFFRRQQHEVVPSSSLVPAGDATLLFTNAGMNQFKDVFLGLEQRPYRRATSCQKCVRAGGKHNDLENVGFTARHHTFFEMLGNFSFGDYFKEEAIAWAWELLTKELGIDSKRLYVTVFETDDQAWEIWHKKIGLPVDRIYRLGEKDNFWRMGDTGPCGPCTEIYYDHGEHLGRYANAYEGIVSGGDRFVEIWNLVFMQFDERSPGQLLPLAKPSVDTGSGLERLTAVLEGTHNNFKTSLFLPILQVAADRAGLDLALLHKQEESERRLVSSLSGLRVLADHIRASSFLIADGVIPSNEGRGYVLRRIIRRALRYAEQLAPEKGLFPELVHPLVQVMGSAYPELAWQKDMIYKTLSDEQAKFISLLKQGEELLSKELLRLGPSRLLPGEVAFRLYDTYGFPLDLTQLILREKGYQVDEAGFEAEKKKAIERSRASWAGRAVGQLERELGDWTAGLVSQVPKTQFIGYQTTQAQARVLAYQSLADGHVALVFDQSPMYPQGGGQVSDQGWIESGAKRYPVEQLVKVNDYLVHIIRGPWSSDAKEVRLVVDETKRRLTARNHSATHLLHAALRAVLGHHVKQAGSEVSSKRLRFDFSHPKALTRDELRAVQDWVNLRIQKAEPTQALEMSFDEAKQRGALAFFEEKYGERVRVMKIGEDSTELCGGTHVSNTAEIGLFVIVSESSVSSGVRRIEALTSERALAYLMRHQVYYQECLAELGQNKSWERYLEGDDNNSVLESIKKLKKELKDTEKKLEETLIKAQSGKLQGSSSGGWSKELLWQGQSLKVSVISLGDLPREALLRLADEKKTQSGPELFILQTDQMSLVGVTKGVSIHCGEVFKRLVAQLGSGKGGGRPDLAQGQLPKIDPGRVQWELVLAL